MTWEWFSTESGIRLLVFFGILVLMSFWELVAPRKSLSAHKPLRWASNLGLALLNSLMLRQLLPMGAVGVATLIETKEWGLFHQFDFPFWLKVVLAVILLDFSIYWQHVVSHKIPLFWKIHRVHHVDLDIDVTTGLRFHTIEIVLSFGFKLLLILIWGISPLAILIFEILLNGTAMFNHSNVKIPLLLDRWLRFFLVTPDMHRVHHSIIPHETDSNYGFNLPWWDYLFKTSIPQPQKGHHEMTIGLGKYQTNQAEQFHWMLWFPFQRDKIEEDQPDN